jgi:hypothetical protein
MVVRYGIEVRIVHADTKIPLKEHIKGGKVFAEAEPNADYYISVQRVTMKKRKYSVILSGYKVDGECLGFTYQHHGIASQPTYIALCNREGSLETTTALRFAKPSALTNGKDYKDSVGKVQVYLYRGHFQGNAKCEDFSTSFQPVLACEGNKGKKKFIVSTKGTASAVKTRSPEMPLYQRGHPLGIITLYYTSAVGLMEHGVVPKPFSAWDYHCLTNQFGPGQLTGCVKRCLHPDDDEKMIEYIDLTDDKKTERYT